MLVLGISPAEACGCLCAERIAGQRGVAVQCLPYVVRCHPQAGRPRDLLLQRREQAPPNVLISHGNASELSIGASVGGPALANAPLAAPASAASGCHARLSQSCTAHTSGPCHRRFCASKSAWPSTHGRPAASSRPRARTAVSTT